ncbi:hypothetical protein CPC08DRAFT_769085 [Agrocybe pediades]|nr:hypothetical protein CPC08DRAFT_769085 [Agrocybe pediades]
MDDPSQWQVALFELPATANPLSLAQQLLHPRPCGPCRSFSQTHLPALLPGPPQPSLVGLRNPCTSLPASSSFAHPASSLTHGPILPRRSPIPAVASFAHLTLPHPSTTPSLTSPTPRPRSPPRCPTARCRSSPIRAPVPTTVGSAAASSVSTPSVRSPHACHAVPPTTPTLSSSRSRLVAQPAGFNLRVSAAVVVQWWGVGMLGWLWLCNDAAMDGVVLR